MNQSEISCGNISPSLKCNIVVRIENSSVNQSSSSVFVHNDLLFRA